MIVGFLKEAFPGELRVALVPSVIPNLKKAGYSILMESGAGERAGFPDADYQDKGAQVNPNRDEVFAQADILVFVRWYSGATPEELDINRLHKGQIVVGHLNPAEHKDDISKMAEKGVTAFALELLPRITRAQSMDVLSSMATVAGYKAVLLAASTLPKMFPLLMTAAGTISPARVLVIGAGVAGLQAIATAKRLGAAVQAYDIRPAVKEQVESLGAKFVELPLEASGTEATSGYAREMDEGFYKRQRELMTRIVAESDVVISTAAVPGKRAPVLITADMVRGMRPGSVIIDLAAAQGGNCELTKPGQTITLENVTIFGPSNLAATIPYDASQMYARNITNFLLHLVGKDGELRIDTEDQIIKETLVTKGGSIPVTSPASSSTPSQ